MRLTEDITSQIKKFNPNNEEIIIIFKEGFISADGDRMKRGYYFYFEDLEEEGIIGPFIDEKETCPKCHNSWLDHDFGVPMPHC